MLLRARSPLPRQFSYFASSNPPEQVSPGEAASGPVQSLLPGNLRRGGRCTCTASMNPCVSRTAPCGFGLRI